MTGYALAKSNTPAVHFLSKTFHLVSFHEKDQPTWQFVTGDETMDNWTTLFTIVDRPDVRPGKELDKLAEDVKSDIAAHGGKVLVSTKMQDINGDFIYLVLGHDEAAKNTYELRFVKVGSGRRNAYVASYSVRITDPQDYAGKTKTFLHGQSAVIGKALSEVSLPDINKLPRSES